MPLPQMAIFLLQGFLSYICLSLSKAACNVGVSEAIKLCHSRNRLSVWQRVAFACSVVLMDMSSATHCSYCTCVQGTTPLHKAAENCHAWAVRALLERGADVNAKDDQVLCSFVAPC